MNWTYHRLKSGVLAIALMGLPIILSGPSKTHAQEPPGARFQPPPPPPMDMGDDLEDDEIEELEGDMPIRPQMPNLGMPGQPPPSGGERPPPPAPSFRGTPTSFTKIGTNANGIRFQIVDGEFYQKGKRRGRVTDLRKAEPSTKLNRIDSR